MILSALLVSNGRDKREREKKTASYLIECLDGSHCGLARSVRSVKPELCDLVNRASKSRLNTRYSI
jgi:hypothetical protein